MRHSQTESDLFDTELHRQWKADRALRLRVPLGQAWRGCLGLAMLLDRPDDTEAHGTLALVRNDQVRWLALRDVPVGRTPGSPVMNRRDVNYANSAVAGLRYGMPVIDFTKDVRDAVDFKFLPTTAYRRQFGRAAWDVERVAPRPDTLDCARRAREFAVLNHMSAAMTRFAFGASDGHGRPLRPAWTDLRPDGQAAFRAARPERWMPRSYLALRERDVHQVGRAVTAGGLGSVAVAVRTAFSSAVAAGLPLVVAGRDMYCGPIRPACKEAVDAAAAAGSRVPAGFVPHKLRGEADGANRIVHLPPSARAVVKQGALLEPGERWASVFCPADPAGDGRRAARVRDAGSGGRSAWAEVVDRCGGPTSAAHLLQTWLAHQAVRLLAAPGEVLIAAELAAGAVRGVTPRALWWDTAPALPFYRWETQAAIVPPIQLRRWDALRLAMPGEVVLDASLSDPRFTRPEVQASPLRVPQTARHRGRDHMFGHVSRVAAQSLALRERVALSA